jgi:hypothetical protein
VHPLLQPPSNLEANPPHWLPNYLNANTIVSLHKSDNLFLDSSITHAEEECIIIIKIDPNNAKPLAINSAHAQHDQPTIRLAQVG